MAFLNRGKGGGVPHLGKIPTFSRFFGNVPYKYIYWNFEESDVYWKEHTCGKDSQGHSAPLYKDQGLTRQAPRDQAQSKVTNWR